MAALFICNRLAIHSCETVVVFQISIPRATFRRSLPLSSASLDSGSSAAFNPSFTNLSASRSPCASFCGLRRYPRDFPLLINFCPSLSIFSPNSCLPQYHPRFKSINPLFPALRSSPTAFSGASRKKQIPSSQSLRSSPTAFSGASRKKQIPSSHSLFHAFILHIDASRRNLCKSK